MPPFFLKKGGVKMSLQEMRKKKKYSVATLSDITGVSLRSIQHYESGYRNINTARLDVICTLALALDCKIEDILTDEDLKRKFRKTQRQK